MSRNYAPGFTTSSKKNKNKKRQQTESIIGPDIIGSRTYEDYVVMKMKEETEVPTQIVDLSGHCSQNSDSVSSDSVSKGGKKNDSNLFAFSSRTTTSKKPMPTKGEWMTKRSSSSLSSSSINSRWSKGKACKRKTIEHDSSVVSTPSRKVNKTKSPMIALEWTESIEKYYKSLDKSEDEYSDVSFHPICNPGEGGEQTTMTQYIRSLDKPVDKPVEKKGSEKKGSVQTTLSQFVTPIKTPVEKKRSLLSLNKFVSRTPGYGVEWRDAMPGDLVMAFASDINHPAFKSGLIHQNYMVIGIVKSFVEVKWDTEMGDDEWDGIATQERLKVNWCDIDGWDSDTCSQPKHPLNSQVKVVGVRRDGSLDGINPQFKALIEEQFEFVRGGWAIKNFMS